MTDPEREHLRETIAQLERSRGRWRLATLVLVAVLMMPVALGGLLGVAWLPRVEMKRARAEMQAREAMEAERHARLQAESARAEAEAERRRTIELKENVQRKVDELKQQADRLRREREKQDDKN